MRVGSARAEPVNTNPRQYLIVSPGIPIRPIHQLLVDPRQERNRAVRKSVRERLRLSSLQDAVRLALIHEPLRALYAFLLRLGVGRQRMLERQRRLRCEARRLGPDHIGVACQNRLRVQHARDAGDVEAPVAALGHVLVVAQRMHQAVARLCLLGERKAGICYSSAEAEV